MAISFVDSAIPSANPTTSYTVTIPAGTQTDDILILSNTNRDADTDPAVTDNDTGGNAWAKVGGTGCGTVWWKRATSGTASKTITAGSQTGSCSGVLKVYRGCRLGTPYENVTSEANASGNESHAAITPTRDGCMVVLCIANDSNDLATTTHAATNPSTLSLIEKLSTGGSDCSNGQAHGIQTGSAGSTGTLSWAQVDGASVSVVFDLMPALTMTAVAGSYATTGNVTGLLFNRKAVTEAGSYSLTGNDATLSHTTGSTYTLLAAGGSYSQSGQAQALLFNRLLTAATGSYATTGFATGLFFNRRLIPDAGVYAYTGFAADLVYSGGGGGGGPAQHGPHNLRFRRGLRRGM